VKYLVVVECGPNNCSAYVPALPGCVAAADTREETERLIKEAIEFHLEGMAADDDPLPDITTYAKEIEVVMPDKYVKQVTRRAS
jgi:predicted RNase H-like HicB family nuclease